MENKDFYIDQDGFKLHAKLDFPDVHADQLPLVILIPGLCGDVEKRFMVQVSERIVSCGYACLRLELYGHGLSDGELCDHSMADWISEMKGVVDLAATWDFVSDIYLAGHSQGGFTDIFVAADKKDRIKGLVLMSPGLCIPDICRAGYFFGKNFDPDHIPERVYFTEELYVKPKYFLDGRTYVLDDAYKAYTGPVLIVHGTLDESVDVRYAIDASEKYANARLVLLQGEDHNYGNHLDQLVEAVGTWFEQQLVM